MSARSQVNATRLLSGDQTGSDGCLISMSCSMVSPDLGAGLRLGVVCVAAVEAHSKLPRMATETTSRSAFDMALPLDAAKSRVGSRTNDRQAGMIIGPTCR